MDKLTLKSARADMNRACVSTLVYLLLMNTVSILVLIGDIALYLTGVLIRGQSLTLYELLEYISNSALNNGWMYLISIAVGLVVVRLWKGRGYWRRDVFVKNKTMTVGSFFSILCIFMSAQFFFQLVSTGLEWLLNLMGLTATAAMELATTSGNTPSMYLYVCILGPIAEELMFRGVILQPLKRWGKNTAILASALVFGLFHGNLPQIPFAFAVGVVLGYVAVEYSILWAIVLHIINNFVLADLMTRLFELLPLALAALLSNGIFMAAAVISIVILICRRKEVAAYARENRDIPAVRKGFCTSPVLIVLVVLMLAMSLLTIQPL